MPILALDPNATSSGLFSEGIGKFPVKREKFPCSEGIPAVPGATSSHTGVSAVLPETVTQSYRFTVSQFGRKQTGIGTPETVTQFHRFTVSQSVNLGVRFDDGFCRPVDDFA